MHPVIGMLVLVAGLALIGGVVALGAFLMDRSATNAGVRKRDYKKAQEALRKVEELAYNARDFEPVLADSVLREARKALR